MNRFLFALSKIAIPLVILGVNSCIPKSAFAQSITLNAIDSGWYSSGGFHSPTIENYVVGRRGPLDYNNFFVFDLSGVEKPIASAFLRISNPADGYQSPDPTEAYTLFNVSTPVSTLKAGGFPLTDIYTDLGSGISFGSQTISAQDNNSVVTIALNATGVASLNSARSGLYAIGGSITTISGLDTQSVFQSTGFGDTRQLIITPVPATVSEPANSPLVAFSFLGLICVATRHRLAKRKVRS